MCFSEQQSLYIGLFGLTTGAYFFTKNKYAGIGIAYFALMEILQYFQYKVIDQCNNKWNKFLTQIGYLHICFQPLFFNIWLFAFTKKPNFLILSFNLLFLKFLIIIFIFFLFNFFKNFLSK